MTEYAPNETDFRYEFAGLPIGQSEQIIFWGHGWGQDKSAFRELAASIPNYTHVLLDFPGFGSAPLPPLDWDTRSYADAAAALIAKLAPGKKITWIGHSFGCRVGLQLGAHHPDILNGMVLIAGAGLKRKRPLLQRVKMKSRVTLFKLARLIVEKLPLPVLVAAFEKYRSKAGSGDYQRAGALRPIFVRVVNEDQTDNARNVKCPTLLIYGAEDTETPPEIGERLHHLILQSELIILPGRDHYSVLTTGRHIVAKHILQFTGKL